MLPDFYLNKINKGKYFCDPKTTHFIQFPTIYQVNMNAHSWGNNDKQVETLVFQVPQIWGGQGTTGSRVAQGYRSSALGEPTGHQEHWPGLFHQREESTTQGEMGKNIQGKGAMEMGSNTAS